MDMKDGEVSGDSSVEEISWSGVTQSQPLGFNLRSESTWTRVGRCRGQGVRSCCVSSKTSWEIDSTFRDQTDVN